MKVQNRHGQILHFQGDSLLLFHSDDVRPLEGSAALLDWRCNAVLSRLWKWKGDLFRFGQITILAPQGRIPAERVILTGLGKRGELDGDLRRETCRVAVGAALRAGARVMAFDAEPLLACGGTVEEIKRILSGLKEAGGIEISLFSVAAEAPRGSPGRAAGGVPT